MSYLILFFQFIISLPKIWQLIVQMMDWLEKRKNDQKLAEREAAKNEMIGGKTQKEREDAADRFIDND